MIRKINQNRNNVKFEKNFNKQIFFSKKVQLLLLEIR